MPKTTIPTKSTGDTLTASEMNNVADALNGSVDNSDPANFYDVRQIEGQYTHTAGAAVVFPVSIEVNNFDYTEGEFQAVGGLDGYVEAQILINVQNAGGGDPTFTLKLQKDTGAGYLDTNFTAVKTIRASVGDTIVLTGVSIIAGGDKLRFLLDIDPNANAEILSGYAILKYVKTL